MTRALVALLLVAVPILSAGQSDVRIVKPEIRVGDSWTYRGTNVLAPGTHEYEHRVTFTDDKVILLVSTRKSDGKEFDSSWTLEWNAVTSYTGRMHRPHTGIFRFPLHIGDMHELKYEMLRPRENTAVNITAGTAMNVGWDTVDVPAGKFHAIKVEAKGVIQQGDGSKESQLQATYWYAPEVRRWVKFQVLTSRISLSEELLAYKLNED
jgi:hypothetical protein